MIGSETALYLASLGRSVTIVDQLPGVALEENAARRFHLMRECDEYQVQTLPNTSPATITDAGVEIEQEGATRLLPCDTVVLEKAVLPDRDPIRQHQDRTLGCGIWDVCAAVECP